MSRYRGWLIYDEEGAVKNRDYIEKHRQLGEAFSFAIELKIIRLSVPFEEEIHRLIEESLTMPDFAIVRTICPMLSAALEKKGVPVFNPAFVSEICNHKGKTMAYIKRHTDVPVIPTETFNNECISKELLTKYPGSVIKSVDGHGGRQVFRTEERWEKICQGIGHSDFIIQSFISGPGKDIRVYVIGDEIVGAVERTCAAEGFRANYSLGGWVKSYTPGREIKEYVCQISRAFDFGMVGIDFIVQGDGSFLFNEIEDVVGARMLYQCQPDVKLLERYFAYIDHRLPGL